MDIRMGKGDLRMVRTLAILSVALAVPSAGFAQASNDALERARAVDACAGRPVLSAEEAEGGRLNVTCGEEGVAANGGAGLGAGAGAALLGGLLLLGLAGGGGGGDSAGGTN
jgi:hypothetical protein